MQDREWRAALGSALRWQQQDPRGWPGVVRGWFTGGLGKHSAPKGGWYGTELPEFKCSDITLRCRVWAWVVLCGARGWTQWSLWVPFNSGYSFHLLWFCYEVMVFFSVFQCFLDMTFGAGGHSTALLEKASNITIYALDRDPTAYKIAQQLSESYP